MLKTCNRTNERLLRVPWLSTLACDVERANPQGGNRRGATDCSRHRATSSERTKTAHRRGLALALASKSAHSASRFMGATGFRRTPEMMHDRAQRGRCIYRLVRLGVIWCYTRNRRTLRFDSCNTGSRSYRLTRFQERTLT